MDGEIILGFAFLSMFSIIVIILFFQLKKQN